MIPHVLITMNTISIITISLLLLLLLLLIIIIIIIIISMLIVITLIVNTVLARGQARVLGHDLCEIFDVDAQHGMLLHLQATPQLAAVLGW